MSIIPQKQLFGWQEIYELGDLQRLSLVLNYLPDEELMKKLEEERGKGRDDYPVRAVWNPMLAGIVYQHPFIESLERSPVRAALLFLSSAPVFVHILPCCGDNTGIAQI